MTRCLAINIHKQLYIDSLLPFYLFNINIMDIYLMDINNYIATVLTRNL